jgi:hypothetical protein
MLVNWSKNDWETGVPGENHQSAASQTNYITIDERETINLKKKYW